jgi:hypothetical protein
VELAHGCIGKSTSIKVLAWIYASSKKSYLPVISEWLGSILFVFLASLLFSFPSFFGFFLCSVPVPVLYIYNWKDVQVSMLPSIQQLISSGVSTLLYR